MERPDLWQLERSHLARGRVLICGVDEAGAGPLAGRVYAAAVILPEGWDSPYLNDSKKVTEKRREALYDRITQEAVAYAIAWADEKEIDEINILKARMLAMERAIQALDPKPDFALIDGNRAMGITCPHETVVKGDGKSASIAAASILAKVARDRYMIEQATLYPQYAFEKHKGYPTKLHYERLEEYGPSPIHRLTFLNKRKTAQGGRSGALGLWGEDQAARFLEEKGYNILARRYRCREGEIDLVAYQGHCLSIVEVKLRKNRTMGEAREYVTRAKRQKLRTAALYYLSEHPTCHPIRFDVVEVYAPQGEQTQNPEILHWENAF